jgi:hypothetical protein
MWLKSFIVCLALLGLVVAVEPANAQAATVADWARNAETDMSGYNVYACLTKGCVVAKSPAQFQVAVPQTAAGVRPRWTLPVGQEGALAISAVDVSGNESGLSVSVPFDSKAPAIPLDVKTQ